MTRPLKIDDVAARAGVSPRTVRYYIQRGLLPAPEFKGPDTTYDERHVVGLQAIKRLQDAYWPLEAIAAELDGKSLDALKKLAANPGAQPKGDGLDAVEPAEKKQGTSAANASLVATRGTRTVLRRGVELWVDDEADDDARALAETIRELVARTRKGGSRR